MLRLSLLLLLLFPSFMLLLLLREKLQFNFFAALKVGCNAEKGKSFPCYKVHVNEL